MIVSANAAMQVSEKADLIGLSGPIKIEAKGITKVYGGKKGAFTALDPVSFDIRENEFVSFVGPSGCGKSSLLRILAGLEEASSGELYISGKEIDGPGVDRGMVFQSYTLFPWLTVRQNIEFGLTLKGIPLFEKRQIADHFMELVQLTKFAKSFPKELSGGMKQRVAIARALANNPEVLLMDEPFGALDPQTKNSMQEMLLNLWEKEKTTVVFITHDIEEAIFLSQRVYVMQAHPGRIKQTVQIPAGLRSSPDGRDSEAFLKLKRQIVAHIGESHDHD
ncbi:ABC transporter ATP-binding protein [Paenibacillus radicis (ex Xue et al. 2023)]|uniref:ABC transporter ATP-binding protein n=1 Tax=Paenibacillus radicis (ex Xue et al. 2023) TaxID=2972489 RepID=A0ABT1YJ72_9BACL|nr:ABC transporter ATP-binding protein [Paenibacillus radicis (ex Xue et al. 2023)]MCR8633233.1 ABC transporter ATP-binding protein [Paenibacillus radicis (ex Xue et al. 2023)]